MYLVSSPTAISIGSRNSLRVEDSCYWYGIGGSLNFEFIYLAITPKMMCNSRTQLGWNFIIIIVSFSLLSSVLHMSFQSFPFAYAQNLTKSVQTNMSNPQYYIPPTISKEAQEILKNLITNIPPLVVPEPDDLKGWQKLNQEVSTMIIQMFQPIVDSYQPNITATKMEGINVLDIKPKDWRDNGKVLVYLHGGGYTLLGANSTIVFAATVANSTGLRVISVDYSLAPFSKWNQTTNEVVSVIQTLRDQGYSLNDIAVFGDSAGGGLAAGATLKMRDEGLGMPAALVLWSPWTDVTGVGDTYFTLRNDDPLLNVDLDRSMASAYANSSDQKNPYVSPVYGNFSSGFPPVLIQVGTKEGLLSDSVRLYQALDQTGVPVKLDVYEGIPHDFQVLFFHNTTESDLAIFKTSNFLREYLGY
jgi:epsilon-lactone hydrolase